MITTTAIEILVYNPKKKAKDWYDGECEVVASEKNKKYLNMIQKGNSRGNKIYQRKRSKEKRKKRWRGLRN